ncbi:MAG TPA: LytR C-terminal domain-containing protein [Acidimicrobiales bacterium]|nr:LytR C-terminal domain-containing protein [Acidimicrobiales bacterium]
MQTTERRHAGTPARPSPVRGVVLVAVAAVLGFFLLRAIDDSGSGIEVADVPDTETSDTPADEGEEPPASDTTAAPEPRPPGEVTIIVANASGVQGAATDQTEALGAAGYLYAPAGNAPEGTELANTEILPAAGFEAEAARLATELGLPPEAVKQMTDPPPVDLAGANILVLLGSDLAQG